MSVYRNTLEMGVNLLTVIFSIILILYRYDADA